MKGKLSFNSLVQQETTENMKVFIFICFLAAARAGVIATNYAPASAVSTVYSSVNAPLVKTLQPVTYTKTLTAPASVYDSVLSTHESRIKSLDGTQHDTFAKTLDIPYASIKKYDSRNSNDGYIAHTVPVYSSAHVLTHPQTTYSVATPVVHQVSSPVTYTAHTGPYVTKTVSPSVTTYASHSPVVAQPAVKITYSEAPLVSHMTFTGLGTSYSW